MFSKEVLLYVINLFEMLYLVVFGQRLAMLSSYSSTMCRVPLCRFIYQCQDFLQVSLYKRPLDSMTRTTTRYSQC